MEMSRRFVTGPLGKAVLFAVCVFVIALFWPVPDVNVRLTAMAVIVSVISLVSSGFMFVRSHTISMKPVLVFTKADADDDNARWFVRNVGNGPAINIVVAKRDEGGEWKDNASIPTLAPGTHFPTKLGGSELQCDYFDIDESPYSSRCKNWITTFPKKEPLPRSSKITRRRGLPSNV